MMIYKKLWETSNIVLPRQLKLKKEKEIKRGPFEMTQSVRSSMILINTTKEHKHMDFSMNIHFS